MVSARYRRIRDELAARPAIDLATIITTLLVAFHGFRAWFFALPAQCAVIAGLIFRRLLCNPLFWVFLAALAASRIYWHWHDVDNHKFILLYWLCCMAIAHAQAGDDLKHRVVTFNARFFLIFIMLGAVAQKASSPSYMDASFFEFELLVDTRFRGFAALFGIDPDLTVRAREFLNMLQSPYHEVEQNAIFLESNPRVTALAVFVTWYDLIIQAVIGVGFLVGGRRGDLIGHLSLLLFIFTAYFAAPVIGFAWTLIIFGAILAKDRFPNILMVYVAALAVTTLYKIPWAQWVT